MVTTVLAVAESGKGSGGEGVVEGLTGAEKRMSSPSPLTVVTDAAARAGGGSVRVSGCATAAVSGDVVG